MRPKITLLPAAPATAGAGYMTANRKQERTRSAQFKCPRFQGNTGTPNAAGDRPRMKMLDRGKRHLGAKSPTKRKTHGRGQSDRRCARYDCARKSRPNEILAAQLMFSHYVGPDQSDRSAVRSD